LVMPPVKVLPVTRTAVAVAAILPPASIRMPDAVPSIVPLSTIDPVMVTAPIRMPV